jgi:AraC family transcriptional regulator
MNRNLGLFKTELIQIGRFDHPPDHEHRDPPEELALDYSVSFVEHGEFAIASRGRKETLRPGSVIFTRPEMHFRCTHPHAHPDDVCLCIAFLDPAAAEEVIPPLAPSAKTKSRWFAPSASNRLAYLRLRLLRLLDRNADAVAIEALAGEMLRVGFGEPDSTGQRAYSRHQLSWYMERIETVRQLLGRECDQQHSLGSLSARVNMSAFHFARVFRALVGKPPHRYLLELRLERAAKLLHGGLNVTDACFQAGFNNLSHFSRRFRRQYGVQPSRFVH